MAVGSTLIVQHVSGSDPAAFVLLRLHDAKRTEPVNIPPPFGFPVEGMPDSDLMQQLQWYLERFLDYPFSPETEKAARVRKALRSWGEAAFNTLFDSRQAGRLFETAIEEQYAQLSLQISSDSAGILSWPWEALRDPERGFLAHSCQIERRLSRVRDPHPLAQTLPRDRVNILLVIARPYQEDIDYRSIARPLVELIAGERLRAHVEVLRPPTFDTLRAHLRRQPGYYHVLHFDGHGTFDVRSEGSLVFEKEDGGADPISAETLTSLLGEHAVPCVVLNACRSGMHGMTDPFASVSAALVRAGMRSVVAMAYSLYVSGAQQFLPAFYRRLFEEGSVAQAVRAGRGQMLARPDRVCVLGTHPLEDWLIPVLYQQDPLDFSFAARSATDAGTSRLPDEVREMLAQRAFVGRDGPLLELERAMRRSPAGIVISGLGGIGKTTLVLGLLEWLDATNGLGEGCFWFSFQELRSAGYVCNRLGEALIGPQFTALTTEERLEALAGVLRQRQFLIVWDNFETVAGNPAGGVEPGLPESDRHLLRRLLEKLRGGSTKVLITSRASEDWLGSSQRFLLKLHGLEGEERWEFVSAVLTDLGLTVDRKDRNLLELMRLLNGHPLAMRVVLPRLAEMPAARVAEALLENQAALRLKGHGEDEEESRLLATLRFAETTLPVSLRPLLVPLAFHEGFVSLDRFGTMARKVDPAWTGDRLDRFAEALERAGLLRDLGHSLCEIHPVLTGFLRATVLEAEESDRDVWAGAFVGSMTELAEVASSRPLNEQQTASHVFGATFQVAAQHAERLAMDRHLAALLQAMGHLSLNAAKHDEARRWFERLAEQSRLRGDQRLEAAAYHQLGMVALQQRDFHTAERWYRRSVEIEGKFEDESGTAKTYHELGNLAWMQHDFEAAKLWYRKSLDITERQNDEAGAARSWYSLGLTAQRQRDFATAETWYQRALEVFERLGNEGDAATAYHQLGRLSEDQHDFSAAERWYRRSVEINERLADQPGAAKTYAHLGIIAQARRDFASAQRWYQKALEIFERLGLDYDSALLYHRLGMIAEGQRDFDTAERWYLRSLEIKDRLKDETGAAETYHHLGRLAQERRDFAAAECWYRRSLEIKERLNNSHAAAITYGQFGVCEAVQQHWTEAARWLVRAVKAFAVCNDRHGVQRSTQNFEVLCRDAPPVIRASLRAIWAEAGLGPGTAPPD